MADYDAREDMVGIPCGTTSTAQGSMSAPTGMVTMSWPSGSTPDPNASAVTDSNFAAAGETTNIVGKSTGPHTAQFALGAGRPD